MTHVEEKPNRFETRAANWDDIPGIVRLLNASAQNTRGADVTADHWQRRHYYESGVQLDTDTRLVLDGDRPVAYVEVAGEWPYVVYEMVGAVDPDYRGRGLGSLLVSWAEERVGAALDKTPPDLAVFIQSRLFESNNPGRELLASQGYAPVRDYIYLAIEMDARPPSPEVPAGVVFRPLQPSDWAKIGPAMDESFQDHWANVDYEDDPNEDEEDDSWARNRAADPEAFDKAFWNSPDFSFVAWDGDEVAGVCLCNEKSIEFPGSGYLGSLSIRRAWRRRGLGRALVLNAFNTFYDRGIYRVITDTDGDSLTGSYRVYQNAGMSVFRSEFVFEKTMRDGRDILNRGPLAAG